MSRGLFPANSSLGVFISLVRVVRAASVSWKVCLACLLQNFMGEELDVSVFCGDSSFHFFPAHKSNAIAIIIITNKHSQHIGSFGRLMMLHTLLDPI